MDKRKQWIINKDFQYKFVMMCVIPAFIMILYFWLSIEFIFYRMVLTGNSMGIPKEHAFFSLLKAQKDEFNVVILVSTLLAIGIFGVWALLFSHKIAGPLYRLRQFTKDLKRDSSGKYPKVKFREGDYFTELADEMNAFLDRESDKKDQ